MQNLCSQAMTLKRKTPSSFCKSFRWTQCNVDFAVKRPLDVCVKASFKPFTLPIPFFRSPWPNQTGRGIWIRNGGAEEVRQIERKSATHSQMFLLCFYCKSRCGSVSHWSASTHTEWVCACSFTRPRSSQFASHPPPCPLFKYFSTVQLQMVMFRNKGYHNE